MALDPGGIIAWLVVGALAGWLAGQLMKGSGYGVVGNIIMGVLGALVGGVTANALGVCGTRGIIGPTVVASIGGVSLRAAVRALPGRSPVKRPATKTGSTADRARPDYSEEWFSRASISPSRRRGLK